MEVSKSEENAHQSAKTACLLGSSTSQLPKSKIIKDVHNKIGHKSTKKHIDLATVCTPLSINVTRIPDDIVSRMSTRNRGRKSLILKTWLQKAIQSKPLKPRNNNIMQGSNSTIKIDCTSDQTSASENKHNLHLLHESAGTSKLNNTTDSEESIEHLMNGASGSQTSNVCQDDNFGCSRTFPYAAKKKSLRKIIMNAQKNTGVNEIRTKLQNPNSNQGNEFFGNEPEGCRRTEPFYGKTIHKRKTTKDSKKESQVKESDSTKENIENVLEIVKESRNDETNCQRIKAHLGRSPKGNNNRTNINDTSDDKACTSEISPNRETLSRKRLNATQKSVKDVKIESKKNENNICLSNSRVSSNKRTCPYDSSEITKKHKTVEETLNEPILNMPNMAVANQMTYNCSDFIDESRMDVKPNIILKKPHLILDRLENQEDLFVSDWKRKKLYENKEHLCNDYHDEVTDVVVKNECPSPKPEADSSLAKHLEENKTEEFFINNKTEISLQNDSTVINVTSSPIGQNTYKTTITGQNNFVENLPAERKEICEDVLYFNDSPNSPMNFFDIPSETPDYPQVLLIKLEQLVDDYKKYTSSEIENITEAYIHRHMSDEIGYLASLWNLSTSMEVNPSSSSPEPDSFCSKETLSIDSGDMSFIENEFHEFHEMQGIEKENDEQITTSTNITEDTAYVRNGPSQERDESATVLTVSDNVSNDSISTSKTPVSNKKESDERQENKSYNYNYKCKVCKIRFTNPSKLKKHLQNYHPIYYEKREKLRMNKLEITEPTTCNVCMVEFDNKAALFDHIIKHTEAELQEAYRNNAMAMKKQKRGNINDELEDGFDDNNDTDDEDVLKIVEDDEPQDQPNEEKTTTEDKEKENPEYIKDKKDISKLRKKKRKKEEEGHTENTTDSGNINISESEQNILSKIAKKKYKRVKRVIEENTLNIEQTYTNENPNEQDLTETNTSVDVISKSNVLLDKKKSVSEGKQEKMKNSNELQTGDLIVEEQQESEKVNQKSSVDCIDEQPTTNVSNKPDELSSVDTTTDADEGTKECLNRSVTVCSCHKDETALLNNQDLQIEMILLCKTCNVHFRRRECFEIHYRTNPDCRTNRMSGRLPKLFCSGCHYALNSLPDMRRHLEFHAQIMSHNTITFLCNICKIVFYGVGTLFYSHWYNHNKDSLFVASRYSFPRISVVQQNLTNADKETAKYREDFLLVAEYVCRICRTPFGSDDELEKHARTPCEVTTQPSTKTDVNKPEAPAKQPVINIFCNKCNKAFSDKTLFDNHTYLKGHIPVSEPRYICVAVTAVQRAYICHVCRAVGKTTNELIEHWSKHNPVIERYSCALCTNYKDVTYEKLQVHFKSWHKTEDVSCIVNYRPVEFICKTCNLGFESSKTLEEHCLIHKPNVAYSLNPGLTNVELPVRDTSFTNTMQNQGDMMTFQNNEYAVVMVPNAAETVNTSQTLNMVVNNVSNEAPAIDTNQVVNVQAINAGNEMPFVLNFTQAVPNFTQTIPNFTQTLPNFIHTVPDFIQTVPDFTQTVPDYTQTVPDLRQTVPEFIQTVPDFTQTLPEVTHTIPNDIQTIPNFTQTESNVIQTVPSATQSVCTFTQTVSNIADTIPNINLESNVAENVNNQPVELNNVHTEDSPTMMMKKRTRARTISKSSDGDNSSENFKRMTQRTKQHNNLTAHLNTATSNDDDKLTVIVDKQTTDTKKATATNDNETNSSETRGVQESEAKEVSRNVTPTILTSSENSNNAEDVIIITDDTSNSSNSTNLLTQTCASLQPFEIVFVPEREEKDTVKEETLGEPKDTEETTKLPDTPAVSNELRSRKKSVIGDEQKQHQSFLRVKNISELQARVEEVDKLWDSTYEQQKNNPVSLSNEASLPLSSFVNATQTMRQTHYPHAVNNWTGEQQIRKISMSSTNTIPSLMSGPPSLVTIDTPKVNMLSDKNLSDKSIQKNHTVSSQLRVDNTTPTSASCSVSSTTTVPQRTFSPRTKYTTTETTNTAVTASTNFRAPYDKTKPTNVANNTALSSTFTCPTCTEFVCTTVSELHTHLLMHYMREHPTQSSYKISEDQVNSMDKSGNGPASYFVNIDNFQEVFDPTKSPPKLMYKCNYCTTFQTIDFVMMRQHQEKIHSVKNRGQVHVYQFSDLAQQVSKTTSPLSPSTKEPPSVNAGVIYRTVDEEEAMRANQPCYYMCNYCVKPVILNSKMSMITHLDKLHNFLCSVCIQRCYTLQELQKHAKERHSALLSV